MPVVAKLRAQIIRTFVDGFSVSDETAGLFGLIFLQENINHAWPVSVAMARICSSASCGTYCGFLLNDDVYKMFDNDRILKSCSISVAKDRHGFVAIGGGKSLDKNDVIMDNWQDSPQPLLVKHTDILDGNIGKKSLNFKDIPLKEAKMLHAAADGVYACLVEKATSGKCGNVYDGFPEVYKVKYKAIPSLPRPGEVPALQKLAATTFAKDELKKRKEKRERTRPTRRV